MDTVDAVGTGYSSLRSHPLGNLISGAYLAMPYQTLYDYLQPITALSSVYTALSSEYKVLSGIYTA